MAITSVGYDGTVDEVQWASMVSKVGGYEYGVDKPGDFAVTQSAGTRMISIAAGLAWGRGVMDISDAAAVIQLEPVTTGSRYDLIALRRNWGPASGGPSELVVIKGTSSKAIPSGRQSNPGVIDDQPLALVRVQAGSASIPEIIDLRVWGRNGGQMYAKDDLVRSYLTSIGTQINVNGIMRERVVGANNTAAWKLVGAEDLPQERRAGSNVFTSGWGISTDYVESERIGRFISVRLSVKRTGGRIEAQKNGNIGNVHLATLSTAFRPKRWEALAPGPSGTVASAYVEGGTGKIFLAAIPGGAQIAAGDLYSFSGVFPANLS